MCHKWWAEEHAEWRSRRVEAAPLAEAHHQGSSARSRVGSVGQAQWEELTWLEDALRAIRRAAGKAERKLSFGIRTDP